MTGCGLRLPLQPVFHDGPDCRAMREQRRLRVMRERERVGRTFEAQLRQRFAECGIGLLKNIRSRRERGGEVLSHPRLLRSLPGEQQDYVHRVRGTGCGVSRSLMSEANDERGPCETR